MSKRSVTEKLQGMRERYNVRRIGRMDTNARHEHIRKQMETYKEKTRMLQQMMESQEALSRELQMMEKEMEAQRREAEVEAILHQKGGVKEPSETAGRRQTDEQIEQMGQQMNRLTENIKHLSESAGAIRDQEQQIRSALEELAGRLDEIRHELNGGFAALREELAGEGEEDSGDTLGRLDEIKEELSEKVHTESVKCYRNVQSLVEETRDELKEACRPSDGAGLRGPLTGAVVLGVINLVLILLLGLYELGVFHFL